MPRELWPAGPVYEGAGVTFDALFLAAFAAGAGKSVCDLGSGDGVVGLLLALSDPETAVTALELRADAAARCGENFRRNGLADRCRALAGDWRTAPLPGGSFDSVVCNPPYYPPSAGAASPDRDRALMRTESSPLSGLCAAAARLLAPGGAFCLVHRSSRREDVLAALAGAGLFPRRLRSFASSAGRESVLFCCEARREPGETVTEPLLIQFGPEGRETAEYRKICHWEEH